jgi:hypothetical protein
MSQTQYLAIDQVAPGQASSYLTVNAAISALEEAENRQLAVDMSGGDVVLTQAQFLGYVLFRCSGLAAAQQLTIPSSIDINVPPVTPTAPQRKFLVRNDSPTYAVTVSDGTASVVVPTQSSALLIYDGTNLDGLVQADAAGTFLGLTDAPSAYTGVGDYVVRVKASEDGLEFHQMKLVDMADVPYMPGAGQDGQVLVWDNASSQFVFADASVQAIDWKESVRVATTAAGTLATDFENGDTVDGIVLATGDRILIKDQATASENGVYTVNVTGAPTRAVDFDEDAEVTSGAACFVEEGSVGGGSIFILTTTGSITVGSSNLSFTELSSGAVPTTFSELMDTPSSYVGQSGKFVSVKATEDGVEFIDPPSAGNYTLTENAQTGTSYTFVLTDADNKFVSGDNVNGITFTIPLNSAVAFPVGSVLNIKQKGSGQITISPDVGVTVNYPSSATMKLREPGSWATLVKDGTDTWSLLGDLEGAPGLTINASDAAYDNTISGLLSADVQAAIDEIVAGFAPIESGTFVPTFSFTTPGDLSVVYAAQEGEYTIIGNRIFVGFKIAFTPTYTTATGTPVVGGLPVPNASGFTQVATVAFHNSNLSYPAGVTEVCPNINSGNDYILMRGNGSGITSQFLTTAQVPSGVGQNWFFQATYPI